MKHFFGLLLLGIILITSVSASTLLTALPMGKGNWAFALSGAQSGNYNNVSNAKVNKYGLSIGYGLSNNFDMYCMYASSKSVDFSVLGGLVPADNATTSYGIVLAYNLLNEIKTKGPFSLTLALGGASFSSKTTAGGTDTIYNGSQGGGALIISKLMIPFVPYAGITYMLQNGDPGTKGVQLDLAIGTVIALSKQFATFIEYSSKGFTPDGGSSYSQGEVAMEFSYAP